ncbi:MAG TPA: hypothetical protein VK427_18690 [Kofleriaceae bacterium]|nr:hypothetical protein [Kofleriaceae bacterium]
MRTVVCALVILCASVAARAEDIAAYEMDGDADAGGSDPRVAALDEAFARAAQAAVGELVDADVRKANKAVIDRELVGRARLWVAKFTVTKDETAEGRRQLTVTVRIDRDKLRARLAELGVASVGAGDVKPGAKSAIVVMRVTSPEGTRATYGATAEKELPGMGAFAATLRATGLQLKRAPASGPAAKPGGELPLADADAAALGAEAKADVIALAGVTVGDPVAVRGVPTNGVLVTAHVKLLPAGGHGMAITAARGSEATVVASAVERALAAAASDVMSAPRAALPPAPTFSGDDTPIGQDGVVLVRMSPKTPWALVVAEQKLLANARGVQRAAIRRVSPRGWVIGVTTTESTERIAQIARKAPATDTAVTVKIVGNIVEVALAGSP